MMTPSELDRYSRQILLAGLGEAGQESLRAATVLVVGLGAMGGNALLYLAGAGVGSLLLLDPTPETVVTAGDRLLQTACRPGVTAAAMAAETLTRLNPTIAATPLPAGLSSLTHHITRCTMVLDAGSPAEYGEVINALCLRHGVPVMAGHVVGNWIHLRQGGCLHCLTPPPLPDLSPGNPADWTELAGGVAGCMLAQQVLLHLTGLSRSQPGRYWDHHGPSGFQRTGTVSGDPACPLCAHPAPPLPTTPTIDNCDRVPVTDEIDITKELCPMTFVRVKLKLESMPPGSRLRIRLTGAEPLANVPRTLLNDHYVVSQPVTDDGIIYTLDAIKPTRS